MNIGPHVLVLCLRAGWVAASRLPARLAAQGCRVSVIAPAGALITHARPVHHLKTFQAPAPLAGLLPALREALSELRPDLIVPGDDDARRVLHALHAALTSGEPEPWPLALIETSLGAARHFEQVGYKSSLVALGAAGLPMPESLLPDSLQEALDFAARVGGDVVLKHDLGAGGTGVVRCRDEGSLRRAYAEATSRPSAPGGRLVVQRWVNGQTVSCNFAAWRGELLAACTSLRECVDPEPFGIVTLARWLPDQRAQALARRVARHFGLSGLGSVQCLLDEASGEPLVMELNSRVTPMSCASAPFGVDLIGALLAGLRGEAVPAPVSPSFERIALFPNEWRRDPQSPALHDPAVFHDVPWDQPQLVQATLDMAMTPR